MTERPTRLELRSADSDGAVFTEFGLAPRLSDPPAARVEIILSRSEWARLGRPEYLDVTVTWQGFW